MSFVQKYKGLVIAFLLGVVFAVFAYHAYTVYLIRNITIANQNDIAAIAQFLQQSSAVPVTPEVN